MFVYRTRGVVAATLGILAVGACSDPAQDTDLRPEGPPDVLAVLVMTDASSQLAEKATYCKPSDPKSPKLVGLPDATTSQICPDDGSQVPEVDTAYPDGWFVRIMFDELLDPNVETLTEIPDADGNPSGTFEGSIAASHPVTLKCASSVNGAMVNVDYDGYYSPAGNSVTWPLGPSLVVKPNDPKSIATNTACTIELNSVIVDKDGNEVPMNERGPFSFKVAPIKVIALDPPTDDPDYENPIDALTIYFDNPYVQFNTAVDISSLCPDADDDGLCDDETVFSIKDVAHPAEGPGYCNTTFAPCGSIADCDAGNGDTVCGRGFCGSSDPNSTTGGSGNPCNTKADCNTSAPDLDNHCGTTYAYSYVPYGLTDAEFGLGPPEPVETEHKYIFSFTAGAKLKDRCGVESTLPTPTADNLLLAHFITNKFDFNKASIATGETASAMKRLEYTWNNVLEGSDTAASQGPPTRLLAGGAYISPAITTSGTTVGFTISPLPKKMTGACPGSGGACPTADLDLAELMIIPPDASGQVQLQGHLQMNTEYTATLKAGTVVKDFYGKTYTNTSDSVIKWKTAAAIAVTGLGVRQPGTVVTIADKGTVTLPTPTTPLDVRIGFNASIDPTTLDLSEVSIEAVGSDTPPPPTLRTTADASDEPNSPYPLAGDSLASGCGNFLTQPSGNYLGGALYAGDNRTGWIGGCTLRLRGVYREGTYKFTLKKDASFKDIFGTSYTQAADQSFTFTVVNADAPVQCL
jgi:hypothetical protein